MLNPAQNPILKASGFDKFGSRVPIPNDIESRVLQPVQKITQPMSLPDLGVADNTVRLWGYGARVKNGAGFFCAPPASQKPTKNSDYLRMFVDDSFTGLKQLGYGIIALPMSDVLYFNGTGEIPNGLGREIMTLYGAQATGSSAAGTNPWNNGNTGRVDLASVLTLTARSHVEDSGLFNVAGSMYYYVPTNKIRWYNGTIWQDLGGGGGGSGKTVNLSHWTHDLSLAGNEVYEHGLGAVPSTVRIQSNRLSENSDGTWDGTNNMCSQWGTVSPGIYQSYVALINSSAGNYAYGHVVSVDSTNVTVRWSKGGAPTGLMDMIITSS